MTVFGYITLGQGRSGGLGSCPAWSGSSHPPASPHTSSPNLLPWLLARHQAYRRPRATACPRTPHRCWGRRAAAAAALLNCLRDVFVCPPRSWRARREPRPRRSHDWRRRSQSAHACNTMMVIERIRRACLCVCVLTTYCGAVQLTPTDRMLAVQPRISRTLASSESPLRTRTRWTFSPYMATAATENLE